LSNLKKDIEVSGIVVKKSYWLDHIFLLPEFLEKSLGKKMFKHLLKKCKAEDIKKMCIWLILIQGSFMKKWDAKTKWNIHQLLKIEQYHY